MNLTVEEFSRLCKENFEVDRSLDDMLKNLISSENGPSIVESRLSGWWAHSAGIDCLRVWVEVSDRERANRIMSREGGDFERVHSASLQRNSDDMARYKILYGIDLDDMSPYNVIIEADDLSPSEVLAIVKGKLREKRMTELITLQESVTTDSRSGTHPNSRDIEELLSSGAILVNKPRGPTSHQLAAVGKEPVGNKEARAWRYTRSFCNWCPHPSMWESN